MSQQLQRHGSYLEDTGKGQHKPTACTDEEDGGDVQGECDGSVGSKNEGADSRDSVEGSEALGEGDNASVDGGTDLFRNKV